MTLFGTASRHAAGHPVGTSPLAVQHHTLAEAIATAFTGSTVFLALTLAVIVIAIRSKRTEAVGA